MKNDLAKNIYKLSWFLVVPIFLLVWLKLCLLKCDGYDELAVRLGLICVFIYFCLLRALKIGSIHFYSHKKIEWGSEFKKLFLIFAVLLVIHACFYFYFLLL